MAVQYEIVCQQFWEHFKYTDKIKNALLKLTTEQTNSLIMLQITSCNAGAVYGVPFSAASCETKMYHSELFPFGSIFVPGVDILSNFLCNEKYTPSGIAERELLSKFLKFLLNTDELSKLKKLDDDPEYISKESDVAVFFARHFLSKLSLEDGYTVDQDCHFTSRTCVCGECKDKTDFGDTSIGSLKAWHGSLDILFGDHSLFGKVMEEEDGNNNPGGKDTDEDECIQFDTWRTKSQVLAEVITFSFLQKKRHPDSPHFLVPCIGIRRRQIIFFFYDCSNDLLLEGPILDLVTAGGSVNYEAVIAVWLVMNHKYFCSGPTSHMLKAPKSQFFIHAQEKLDLYKNNLRFRNVSKVSEQFVKKSEKVRKLDTLFVWPEDIDNPTKKIKNNNT